MSVHHNEMINLAEEDASYGSGEDINMVDGHSKHPSAMPSGSVRQKRGRKSSGDAIVDAMLEIAAASKMRASIMARNEDHFSISKCIKVLDEIEGVDQRTYFRALDLFEVPAARETFISLKRERRVIWLQRKCGIFSDSVFLVGDPIKVLVMDDIDIDIELDEMELVAAAAGYYYYNSMTKIPRRVLPPGQPSYMEELMNSPEEECRRMLRMDKRVFLKLSGILRQKCLLRDTNGMMIEEQLAIFLNIIGHNERNRVIQDRYQHSGETISRHFNSVLKVIKSLSREFLQPPPQHTPLQVLANKRLHPYFQDCIGVVDCMRIPAHVPVKDQPRFRDKRGYLTQNVVAACTFDLQFIFICPGWEGSTSDYHVLRSVLDDPDQKFPPAPEGKYYLIDMAFPTMKDFMAPYQGVRHLIDSYRGANRLPRNAKELFNHRHASLSHASLRTFDVLRERFPILKIATQYSFQIQRDVVIAACVIHNFIHREDSRDWLISSAQEKMVSDASTSDEVVDGQMSGSMEDQIAVAQRDTIAASMWEEFVNDWNEW